METLRDFIARRRVEIDEAEASLRKSIEALADERQQLHRAAFAAGIAFDTEARPVPRAAEPAPRRPGVSMKEGVVHVLKENGRAMTALEILPLLNEYLGSAFERTSLSPQLSRLKADGLVRRDGAKWELIPEPETNEATDDVPEKVASVASDQQPNSAPVEPGEEVGHEKSVDSLFE